MTGFGRLATPAPGQAVGALGAFGPHGFRTAPAGLRRQNPRGFRGAAAVTEGG